jgi:quercetin dioxygenase-like cupin family protein
VAEAEAHAAAPRVAQPVNYTRTDFPMTVTRRISVYRWDELPLEKITEMVARKTIVGARVVLAQSYLKKGALVHQHAHLFEQFVYVLQGALRAVVDGEETTVHEGEILQIPGGAAHQMEALDDTFVMTVTGR